MKKDVSAAPRKAKMTPYEELMAYADETSEQTVGWHGELIDAALVKWRHGIAQDELLRLYNSGRVVGFDDDAKTGLLFPDAQFNDGAAVVGIDQVIDVIEIADEAWLWLLQPSPYLEGEIPLEQLKRGNIAIVVAAAHAQYDMW